MRKRNTLVYGVGINDADYQIRINEIIGYSEAGKPIQKLLWVCPFYQPWSAMLKRCYSVKCSDSYPTYNKCNVIDEWLTFSNFKAWMETQDWEGKHLDKDILFVDNKTYCPERCVFVDKSVNTFILTSNVVGNAGLTGVYMTEDFKYKASCAEFGGKRKHLGTFNTAEEAHASWLKYKTKLAYEIAAKQDDQRVADALIDRYENYSKYFKS